MAFCLLRALLNNFWDTIHPTLEDHGLHARAWPLDCLAKKLISDLLLYPLTQQGFRTEEYSLKSYSLARTLGYEAEATDELGSCYRAEAVQEGSITTEGFEAAFSSTPLEYYCVLNKDVRLAVNALDQLVETSKERVGASFSVFKPLQKALAEFSRISERLMEKKSRQQSPLDTPFVRRDKFAAGNGGMGKRMKTEDILRPISEDKPSGSNLRYHSDFAHIKEARRVDGFIQGEWYPHLKAADFSLVTKLAETLLAKYTKDIHIAIWLAEARFHTDGFPGLANGLLLLKALLNNFWDTIYPEVEDGDLESRAAPIEFITRKLSLDLRLYPLTHQGPHLEEYNLNNYSPARKVGCEGEAADELDRYRAEPLQEKAITPEGFDAAWSSTPLEYYSVLNNNVRLAVDALDQLIKTCEQKFGNSSPSLEPLQKALTEFAKVIGVLIEKKSRQQSLSDASADKYRAGAIPTRLGIPRKKKNKG